MKSRTSINNEQAVNMYLADRANYYDSGDGPTRDLQNIRSGLKPFVQVLGEQLLADLNAPALADLRDAWVHEGKVIRSTINRRLQYIIRMVKWCIERGHSTPEQLIGLNAVEKLRKGRYRVKDGEPVRPVSEEAVKAVTPHLPPQMQAWVELLQLTGMRPGEARIMQLRDLERITANNKPGFRYTPCKHKTEHHGKRRRVFLVGRAYQITIRANLITRQDDALRARVRGVSLFTRRRW